MLRIWRTPPDDPTLWHKWFAFIPVQCLDGLIWFGRLSFGPVWRKITPDGALYMRRPETYEELLERQW